jgi:hypothetical protein
MASRRTSTPAATPDWAELAKLAMDVQTHVTGQPAGYGKTAGYQEVQLYFDGSREAAQQWRVSYVAGINGTRRSWKSTYGATPLAALAAARGAQLASPEDKPAEDKPVLVETPASDGSVTAVPTDESETDRQMEGAAADAE